MYLKELVTRYRYHLLGTTRYIVSRNVPSFNCASYERHFLMFIAGAQEFKS